MSPDEILRQLDAAIEILEEAGAIALHHFRALSGVENKAAGGAFDPVTVADREIEAQVRARLRERFPEHGILGEEEEAHAGANDACWVLDPIDGTRAFLSGLPIWGMLLGLSVASRPVAGVMHQPYIGETFAGSGEGGSWLRRGAERTPLATRDTTRIDEAILYSTDPALFRDDGADAFERVASACRMRRFGSDCYGYCLVAMGQADLVIEDLLQPYDIVPLIPIIEGAGGVVTNREGHSAHEGGFVVAAGNRELHARTLELLNTK